MNDPKIESSESSAPIESESSLIQNRKEKLSHLRETGVNPYPAADPLLENRISSSEIKQKFDSVQTGEESAETVRFSGRIITRREMGKASFAHLQDFEGKIQIYIRKDAVGEKIYEFFCKDLDIGDIIGIEGKVFRTKTGELSIKTGKLSLLSKSLRPLPEKWHGLKDIEIRSRQRELDLIANPESKETFVIRSRIIQSLRSILYRQNFLEVETPMMQSIPGGAVAKPFETYHNALGQKFYLRVAPELYLKRCLVGGFSKVFEIGRVFRNEGIDSLHNPEFTILEAYESYGNMESMIRLTELLITETAKAVQAKNFENISSPFNRFSIFELFKKYVGEEEAHWVREQNWTALSKKHSGGELDYKVYDHIFDEKIAPHLVEPTFVTEFPSDFSPLAKCKEGEPNVAERFELYIQGQEVANAYSEMNDPIRQREQLEKYHTSRTSGSKKEKDEEKEGMGLDESFITALEYGMPPAGGLGIGVDRLVMLFTGQSSIRDILLFPTLKAQGSV